MDRCACRVTSGRVHTVDVRTTTLCALIHGPQCLHWKSLVMSECRAVSRGHVPCPFATSHLWPSAKLASRSRAINFATTAIAMSLAWNRKLRAGRLHARALSNSALEHGRSTCSAATDTEINARHVGELWNRRGSLDSEAQEVRSCTCTRVSRRGRRKVPLGECTLRTNGLRPPCCADQTLKR